MKREADKKRATIVCEATNLDEGAGIAEKSGGVG